MRKCHGWTPRKAGKVLSSFELRKTSRKTSEKPKRLYKGIICPEPECTSVVKRIHNHLIQVHKHKKGTAEYKRLLAAAIRHNPPAMSAASMTEESSESDVVSSSESFKASPCKVKKSHIRNIFDRVYTSSEDNDDNEDNENGENATIENEEQLDAQNEEQPDDQPEEDKSSHSHSPYLSNDDADWKEANDGDEHGDEEEEDDDDDDDDDDGIDDKGIDDVMNDEDNSLDINIPDLFIQFENWLKGPDGGQKDDKSSRLCRRQVQLVLQFIDGEHADLQNILHKRLLRDKWLTVFDKKRKPGTVRSYLGGLQQFYIFLKCEAVDVGVPPETLTSLSEQMKLWSKSYRKLGKERFWEKRMEDLDNIITPEQVSQYEVSDVARSAVKLLGDYDDQSGVLDQPGYILVRDYLLTVLCINNGCRSGTLANMTLHEFENASEEDGSFVMKVKNHKTFSTHGPVDLVFTPTLFNYVKIYIAKFRNQLEGVSTDDDSTVFLTWRAGVMNSSLIGAQMKSCWKKVFGKECSVEGATAFRKAVVSAVHEQNEGLRTDLANLMVHKRTTADNYYLLKTKGKTAAKTSQQVTKIMRPSPKKRKAPSITNDDNEGTSRQKRCKDVTVMEPTPRRHKWTLEQVAVLEQVFSVQIIERCITLPDVRRIAKEEPLLRDMCPNKIRDKVRSYFSSKEPEPLALPSELETKQQQLARFGIESRKENTGINYFILPYYRKLTMHFIHVT